MKDDKKEEKLVGTLAEIEREEEEDPEDVENFGLLPDELEEEREIIKKERKPTLRERDASLQVKSLPEPELPEPTLGAKKPKIILSRDLKE